MLQQGLLISVLVGWFVLNVIVGAWLFLRPPQHFGSADPPRGQGLEARTGLEAQTYENR